MKFKKMVSGVLACALVVTSAFTGNVTTVKAAGSGSDGQPAAVSDDDAKVPEPMLQFTFDNDCTTDAKGVAKATGSGTTQITKDNERENVLSLSNNGFLAITNKDNEKSPLVGKTALTISYWSKNAGGDGWAYFIKQDSAKTDWNNNQRYTAGIDTGGDVKTERFWGATNGGRANGSTTVSEKFDAASWKQVTVVLDTDSTTIYVNGEQKATQAGQNKTGDDAGAHQLSDYLADTSLFWIGKADWESGQFFTGYIDDFIVYDKALTAEQVKAAYDSCFVSLTVNFKCGDKVLSTAQEARYVSASYTYVPKTEDATISVDGKIYVRETEQNGLTVTDPAEAINVAYKEASVATVDKTEFEATTRIGVAPKLPENIGVTFEGGATSEAPIEWAITPADYAAETSEPKIINGTVGGKPVTLALTVKDKSRYLITDYTFDAGADGLSDASKEESYGAAMGASRLVEGLKGKAIHLPGGARGTGYVKFADDILQVGDNKEATNITVSLFTKKLGDWSQWSWPMALKSKDTNNYLAIQQRGNGLTGYQAEFKVGGKAYAVNTGNQTNTDWMHLAITLDSENHKMSFYQNGRLVDEVEDKEGGIDLSKLPGGEGVQSVLGYSPFAADVDYNGEIDEFKIYNTVLTEGEIKTICDDLLNDHQMEKTLTGLRALTFESWDGQEVDSTKVVDDFVLPLEGNGYKSKITWASSNDEVINVETAGKAIVTQPRGENAEDEEVTLTATVQIAGYQGTQDVEFKVTVLKLEGVDKKELRHAVHDAKEEYEAARKKIDLYSAKSLTKLSTAINDAEAALENADLTEEQLTQKLAALNDARKLQFKDLDELKESGLLIAWYPLDEDAKDASGNGADGEAASSVKFSRTSGATFNGSTALQNMIKLPADKLKITEDTEDMTFSFSINAGTTEKANNFFGIGSTTGNGSTAKHLYLSGAAKADGLTAYVSKNGWGSGGHKGYANESCKRGEWHDITVILKGRTITLYIDGVKKNTVNTDISLPEAWAADGTQYAYIGNCAYGHNGDLDYLGSIKDVRIYNIALEDEQIDYIAKYRAGLPMTYAKRDLIAGMKELGATEDADGNYALDIIETADAATKTLAFPRKVNENKTDVTWAAEGTGADAIDVSTGVVTIPEAGTVKEFTLKATIQVGEETETFTYNCRAFWEDPTLDKTQLNNRLNVLNGYKGDNYTAASYAAFRKTLQDVRASVPTLTTQDAVTAQIGVLDEAEQSLIDISGLRGKFDELEAELVTLDENDYTEASWDALKEQMEKAEALLERAKDADADPAVSENDVTLQTNALTTARTGLKACGSKESLIKAIADAKALSKYEKAYTEASWSALQNALQTAEGKLNERLEDYAPAATALNTAVSSLVIKDDHKLEGEIKTQLQKQLADARAEVQNLSKDSFIDTSWQEYQDALDAFEAVLAKDKVTLDEAQEAATAVEAARAALAVKSSEKAASAEKTNLENAIAGVITAGGDYTEESWTAYQNAKATVDKLLARMNAEEHNVTKDEVTKAITALNTAAGNLEPTEAQRLTDDDKTALTQAVADAKALNLTYYTAESKKAYEDALADLDALTKKNNVTKNEVKAAQEALATAKAGLTLTEEQKPTPEKKQEFADAYKAETDKDLKAADYTEESWARYQAALTAAADLSERLTQENNNVAKDEIDAVVAELKAAYEALAKPAPVTPDTDKTALNTAITAANKLVKKTYTTSTWNAFQTALTNAKNVYAKEDATQKEIDDAVKALKAKQSALKKAVTKITITDKATGSKAPKIANGKKVTLKVAVAPAGASSSVTWSVDSKSKKYASVSKKGVVTTKKAGAGKKATIIATAKDGSKKTGKITITIMKNSVTKVTLKASKKSVKAGKSVTVKATVKTNGKKANKTLAWKSSNTKWATVNSKGKVTTKKAGKGKTVTITATATDGTGKKASVKIKITK